MIKLRCESALSVVREEATMVVVVVVMEERDEVGQG